MQSRLAYRLLNLPYHHSVLSLFPLNIQRSLATPHNYSDHFISRDWKQNYKSLCQYSSTLNRIFSHLRLSIQPFCQYYPPQLDPSLPAINFASLIQLVMFMSLFDSSLSLGSSFIIKKIIKKIKIFINDIKYLIFG
jgi:hypothetical protein